ncbi:MAG TPA: hypothetical protein V6C76_15075 [Drouetiella sp.]
MVFKRISLTALCACSVVFGFAPNAYATDSKEEIVEALKGTELPSGSMDGLDDKALSEVALLTKTLEAKRDSYARALELYIERIGAGKDVDSALIEYERAEISLGAEWKNTRKVLDIIKKQEHLAHEWKRHRSLHPQHAMIEHHPSHPNEGQQSSEHNGSNPVIQPQEHHSMNPIAQPSKTQADAAPVEPLY